MQTGYAPQDTLAGQIADPAPAAKMHADVASVVLLDSRALVRDCLARGIRAEWPAAKLVATGWDLIDALPGRDAVELCVVSLGCPGSGSLERVQAAFPSAALVILSDSDDYASISQAAAQGA